MPPSVHLSTHDSNLSFMVGLSLRQKGNNNITVGLERQISVENERAV